MSNSAFPFRSKMICNNSDFDNLFLDLFTYTGLDFFSDTFSILYIRGISLSLFGSDFFLIFSDTFSILYISDISLSLFGFDLGNFSDFWKILFGLGNLLKRWIYFRVWVKIISTILFYR